MLPWSSSRSGSVTEPGEPKIVGAHLWFVRPERGVSGSLRRRRAERRVPSGPTATTPVSGASPVPSTMVPPFDHEIVHSADTFKIVNSMRMAKPALHILRQCLAKMLFRIDQNSQIEKDCELHDRRDRANSRNRSARISMTNGSVATPKFSAA